VPKVPREGKGRGEKSREGEKNKRDSFGVLLKGILTPQAAEIIQ